MMGGQSKLWQPNPATIQATNLSRFIGQVGASHPDIDDYDALYRWSVNATGEFWAELWKFSGVIAGEPWTRIVDDAGKMPGAKWFAGAMFNYAENMLRYRDDRMAIVFASENGQRTRLSYQGLYTKVAECAAYLRSVGIQPGDRVAGYMANCPEAIIAMLATASIGAIWSSCSPDFGVRGVCERFAQIAPRVLFASDHYEYNGKTYNKSEHIRQVAAEIPDIEHVVITSLPGVEGLPVDMGLGNAVHYCDLASIAEDAGEDITQLRFVRLPFAHPLYILYSSGTTGKPKCIVHSAGGTLLQHLKEHQLHTDIGRDDVLFYFTTCGWMMWNWLASGLASGCTLVLYEGAAFFPRRESLWELVAELGITVFGTSARYIAECAKSGQIPGQSADLGSLRAILSTGSPLVAENFDYVYRKIKPDIMLSSISGGTDIISCFVLGNPLRAVHRGEIQGAGLGMAVAVRNESGAVIGQRGELVCTRAFPSMPLGFWNEPDDTRYLDAYFSRFEGIWAQGDYAEHTHNDGFIIHGRSDAVLNPGGVRIGTAEIYRQVEKVDEVIESLAIAQRWQGDVRIVLFVVLREGETLTAKLKSQICDTIRNNATPRHVPKKTIAVADLPRTRSGKIAELAVRNIVHGDPVHNTEALANPEALECFRNLPELQ